MPQHLEEQWTVPILMPLLMSKVMKVTIEISDQIILTDLPKEAQRD